MAAAVKGLTSVVNVLETYRGRDRVMRFLTYAAMFLGGDGRTPLQIKWKILSSELSGCRVILRLFDDLSMLLYNMSISFGRKEKGLLKPLEICTAFFNQLYYPSEHIAWFRQKKILNGNSAPFSLLGLLFWALALLGEIAKCLVRLMRLNAQAKSLQKQRKLDRDSSHETSPQNIQIQENLKKLTAEKMDCILLFLQYSCDFINAISWMPPGVLWAQKLKSSTNGILGMIASFIMLYRNWPSSQNS
ncbi:Peroxisomal membrane protein 11C [Biomphalaria glabrata]|nr:peroxisomal membrane protein 11C-like [Biomphalaria glabrata]